jgi:broad specificity phosphatase PhoE
LIRHGESAGNVAATLQGCRLDTPLSPRGRRQAECLSVRLAEEPMDVVYASPLERARQTAELVAAPHGIPVKIDRDLVEFDWGEWTGRPLDDEMERLVSELRARWRAGEVDAPTPGGESPVAAARRARRFLERLKVAGPLAPTIVAHGRFNRVLMTVLLERDLARMDEIRQRNGSLSLFEGNGDGSCRALLLDDVEHLTPDLRVVTKGSDSVK